MFFEMPFVKIYTREKITQKTRIVKTFTEVKKNTIFLAQKFFL